MAEKKGKDLLRIKESIERKMTISSNAPKLELKVNIVEAAMGKIPSPEIDLTKPLEGLWGWILESLQGRRYARKQI